MDSLVPTLDDSQLIPRRSFGYRLWMLRHAWTRRLEAVLAPTGLTHMQFFLMRAIQQLNSDGHTPSQTRLADGMHIDRMTVSKVVRTLEAKGLVTRTANPADSRANTVALTADGASLADRAATLAIAEQDRFFGRLGPDRKAEFSDMLDELLANPGCPFMTTERP